MKKISVDGSCEKSGSEGNRMICMLRGIYLY